MPAPSFQTKHAHECAASPLQLRRNTHLKDQEGNLNIPLRKSVRYGAVVESSAFPVKYSTLDSQNGLYSEGIIEAHIDHRNELHGSNALHSLLRSTVQSLLPVHRAKDYSQNHCGRQPDLYIQIDFLHTLLPSLCTAHMTEQIYTNQAYAWAACRSAVCFTHTGSGCQCSVECACTYAKVINMVLWAEQQSGRSSQHCTGDSASSRYSSWPG